MAFDPNKLFLIGTLSTSRRIPPEFKAPLDHISSSIGEMVWAWNYCHSAFYRLFGTLVNPGNLGVGYSLWHIIKNDSDQREMVNLAAQESLKEHPKILRSINWAVERVGKLGNKRNDVIHSATALQVKTGKLVVDSLATRPSRANRLKGVDIHADLKLVRGDLVAMAGFVMLVNSALTSPEHTLPKKPRLRSIPAARQRSKKGARRRRRQARHKRPRSS